MKSLLVAFLLFAFVISGCEDKPAVPLPVGEMNEYRDPGFGFKIKYPKEWKQIGSAGNAVFAASQDVIDKFQNPSTGIEGAMVTAQVIKYDGKPAEAIIASAKDELKQTWQNLEFTQDNSISTYSKATNLTYKIPVTSKKSILGIEYYVVGDTALYKVSFMAFGGDQATIHTNIFNEMMKSFEVPVVVKKEDDKWAASPDMATYTSNFFTMQYPDNLEFAQVAKGDKDLAMEMRADRPDCSIHIDVFGAAKLTVDKVWEQNKGTYKSKGTGNSTIDGEKTFWVDYSPRTNINSRAYFVVKNDKVIRITVNWFAPQREIYFTAFENSIKSIKLK